MGKEYKGMGFGEGSAGSGSEWGRGEQAGDRAPWVLLHQEPLWGSSVEPHYLPPVRKLLPDNHLARPSKRPSSLPGFMGGAHPETPFPGPHLLLPQAGPVLVKQPVGHQDGEARRGREGRLLTEGDGMTLSHPGFRMQWETDP